MLSLPRSRSAVSRVLFITLLVQSVAALLYGVGYGGSFLVFNLVISAILFVLAFAAWRQNRWGYLAAVILGIFLLFADLVADPAHTLAIQLENPTSPPFANILLFFLAIFVEIPYGTYGFYSARKSGSQPKQISRVSALALIAVGFAIGGLFVGSLTAGTIGRLTNDAGTKADITIVLGAGNEGSGQFYVPDSFKVSVGNQVVWFNRDTAAHTVTGDTNAFDSGNMPSGALYSVTFNHTGTYEYHCLYHAWMKGTIVVSSG